MSNLRIAELDFDQIKTNLKNYLKAQNEFSDYDFEGSGLSVLLDVMAYNTHYNAYLANMVVNEMFLDSAVKRSSAVSIAKHLGYTPVSARGAIANLDVVVTSPTGLPASLTMDRYTPFTSTIDGTAYTFLTTEAKTASRVGTTYTFSGVDVTEGTLLSYSYAVSDTTPNAKYEIPSSAVDTTTIKVTVQTSSSDTTTSTYTLATDIIGLDSTSKVYFLEQNTQGKYQIYFGDGIIGNDLTAGNIITIQYMVSSGSVVNVSSTISQTFAAAGTIGGSSNINTTVNSNSTGGADAESITSIKFNAPRVNASKNRAVTATDYEALILANYAGAESVSVWGGEDNDPPYYGKVMVSLKPYSGYTISDATKETIKNTILKSKQAITVAPVFVNPEYFYVGITADIGYNSSITTLSSDQIKSAVTSAITTYFSTNLQKFNKDYTHSALTNAILDSNSSITSALLTLKLQRRITPVLNTTNVFTGDTSIKYRNPIKPGTILSSYFYITLNGVQTLVKITDLPDTTPPSDTGTGTLRLVNVVNSSIVATNIGTVDYGNGIISITSITPTGIPTGVTDIRISASVQEASYNLVVSRNEILVQDDTTTNKVGGLVPGTTVTVTASV
ncbi:baseplate wedge subunit [uncultured Caudovirales phage]|uniref:Baseplate wedge subunit n=1 Tax=uncultured Caudovirales phage TaxID=2100421 RepID=A0A6J7WYB9_9CAUD|nr:baseplate wedge subunit [uncultured Caudovirales phage]